MNRKDGTRCGSGGSALLKLGWVGVAMLMTGCSITVPLNGTILPSYEGREFEPAGPVSDFHPDRACSNDLPPIGERSTLEKCSEICGELSPAWGTVTSPTLSVWQCRKGESAWQVALEARDIQRSWPSKGYVQPERKADCPRLLEGGAVKCKFLTDRKLWRVFVCENARRSFPIAVEDATTIERESDDQCSVVDEIQAHGIVNTLPAITEYETLESPLQGDAADEADLRSIHADISGDFTATISGHEITVTMGAFGTTDRISIEAYSEGLNLDLGYFGSLQRVSFSGTAPNRSAVLGAQNFLIKTNPNGVSVLGTQIRWYEGDRVELDLTINDGTVRIYTDILKQL